MAVVVEVVVEVWDVGIARRRRRIKTTTTRNVWRYSSIGSSTRSSLRIITLCQRTEGTTTTTRGKEKGGVCRMEENESLDGDGYGRNGLGDKEEKTLCSKQDSVI